MSAGAPVLEDDARVRFIVKPSAMALALLATWIMRTISSLLFTFLVSACAVDEAAKAAPADDFTSLGLPGETSDRSSSRILVVGALETDEPSAPVRYTPRPLYRAFTFAGAPDESLDIWVRSADGDAVAWLLDSSGRILGSNDDADATTFDAHILVTLPATTNRSTHYIVFREYSLRNATFTVQLRRPDTCTILAYCIPGWHWDQEACNCVPD